MFGTAEKWKRALISPLGNQNPAGFYFPENGIETANLVYKETKGLDGFSDPLGQLFDQLPKDSVDLCPGSRS